MAFGAALRRHHRFAIDFGAGAGARLRDISLSGMRVLTNRAMRLDEKIETSLKTPFGILRLGGKVVRGQRSGLEALRYEYGIEFGDLEAGAELVLRRYLDDLGARSSINPESPLDALDFDRLRDRIEELEMQMKYRETAEQERVDTGKVAVRPAHEVDDGDFATSFERERFAHLVGIGQPLLVLAPDCGDRVAGDECRMVAATFGDRVDIESVRASGLEDEANIEILFTFYERQLIDFA